MSSAASACPSSATLLSVQSPSSSTQPAAKQCDERTVHLRIYTSSEEPRSYGCYVPEYCTAASALSVDELLPALSDLLKSVFQDYLDDGNDVPPANPDPSPAAYPTGGPGFFGRRQLTVEFQH